MPTGYGSSPRLPVKAPPPLTSMHMQYGLPGKASKTTSNLFSFEDSGPMDISVTVTRHYLPDLVHWPENKTHLQLPQAANNLQPLTRQSNRRRATPHMAPHSLVAFLAHQQQPITKSTVLSGRQVV